MQRLAYIVNWPLHTIVNSYQYQVYSVGSHNNVSKHDLIYLGPRHNKWPRKVPFKLLKGQGTLLSLFKSLPFIQQLEEEPAPVCRPRDKSV